MTYQYDLFVIGAGSGGVRAARMSAGFGAKVAIAENRRLGGTCVNAGCIPKKLLTYAAHYSQDFRDSLSYGWRHDAAAFDWTGLVANKDREIARLNGVYDSLLQKSGVDVIQGYAELRDPHTVAVNGREFRAERVLIATGARPNLPDIPGREFVITSDDAFHLEQLPRRVLIVGGGYIAVEFAGIFNGLGVETTLAYRGELFLRGFDGEARRFLAGEMRRQGVRLEFNSEITAVSKSGAACLARTAAGGAYTVDAVLYATGRVPDSGSIGARQLGVAVNADGAIIVNEDMQTTVSSIYAIGDVTHRFNLTPVATAEGTAFARTQFGNQHARVDYDNIPTCIFSRPNLAAVGLTEEDARARRMDPRIFTSTFTPLKHTLTGSGEKAFMKLVVDGMSDRVLGAHLVGADAGEIIQGIAIAIKAGATKTQFDATIGIHPTLAEEFVTMRDPVG
jgi:glutathione reductase (NADPH)